MTKRDWEKLRAECQARVEAGLRVKDPFYKTNVGRPLESVVREYVIRTLAYVDDDRDEAAKRLGLSEKTLRKYLESQ